MKKCAICGKLHDLNAATCDACGEASWVDIAEPLADTQRSPSVQPEPRRKVRR